ncbi:hypothetical protein DVH24_012410 [Malus domestica]|uniref:Uncharacterized protein n=1 Tax=Malus domestica TaxID=3750 RepID=A0A498HMM8_MALDO|nr:hypothetical protein DVH24_012410 [Malus domestica]
MVTEDAFPLLAAFISLNINLSYIKSIELSQLKPIALFQIVLLFLVNKMVKEIDRSEQQILEGDLARNDEKNEGTIVKYFDTAPGPSTKKSVKIEKTRFSLRVK